MVGSVKVRNVTLPAEALSAILMKETGLVEMNTRMQS